MEKPTKILSGEHQHILQVIDVLDKECDAIEVGKELDKDFFLEAIDFIRSYADKFHHAKEEDILFKEFCRDDVEAHCNPVPQMLHEHDLGRSFVKEMEEGVDSGDKSKVVDNARNYAELLREHISKEDNILYPMADEALSEAAQERMIEKFKEVETQFDEIKKRCLGIAEKFKER